MQAPFFERTSAIITHIASVGPPGSLNPKPYGNPISGHLFGGGRTPPSISSEFANERVQNSDRGLGLRGFTRLRVLPALQLAF